MLIWTSRNIPNVGLFSAYAEVFLNREPCLSRDRPFLCLRRGVSWLHLFRYFLRSFSLPTQRCFRDGFRVLRPRGLFSAYAEVFPVTLRTLSASMTFLCLRRGVSILPTRRTGGKSFSLPTQRCFHSSQRPRRKPELFSAYAEVFLADWSFGVDTKDFSLPTQRCFLRASRPKSFSVLFSAYAEVFLTELWQATR